MKMTLLFGSEKAEWESDTCEDCGVTQGVKCYEGERDSFGVEGVNLCDSCAAKSAEVESECDWCHEPSDTCGPRKSLDSGDVYFTCSSCWGDYVERMSD